MLELYEPQVEDLWFKEKMMGDEQTMSYNHSYGGIIPFPKEYWADWHDRWITNHNGKRFYRYIKDRDTFVGEVAYHFDGERQIYIAMDFANIKQKLIKIRGTNRYITFWEKR